MPLIPTQAKPQVDPENSNAGWLVGGLSTVGLLLGAVGIGTGDVPRVLRNEPGWAIATFVLVVLASLASAAAGWLTNDKGTEKILIRFGAFGLAAATIAALGTGIASAKERPEPTVTAQIVTDGQDRGTLHFGVKDTGLRSRDKMGVQVRSIDASTNPATATILYAASLGPNGGGEIDHSGEVTVPPAPANDVELQAWVGTRHTCSMKEGVASTGCVKLHVNRLFEKPQLTVAWRDPFHSAAGLTVALSAHDIAGHRVVLRILAAGGHQLLGATWPSSGAGSVDETLTAIIPRATSQICVAASTTEDAPSCTAPPGSGDAAVLTSVPPS